MSVYYPASDSIEVFPTTKRGDTQKSARLITEQSFVSIVNRLLDIKSFVITRQFSYSKVDKRKFLIKNASSLEFNICGYYFKLTDTTKMINNFIDFIYYNDNAVIKGTSIYANIHTFMTGDYEELYGTDNNGTYDGLVLTLNKPLLSTDKYLKILEYDGSNWIIPEESLYKYTYDRIGSIDCGEI